MPIPAPSNYLKTNLGNNFVTLGKIVQTIPVSAAAVQPGANLGNMAASVAAISAILQNAVHAGHVTMADRQNMALEFQKIAIELTTPP